MKTGKISKTKIFATMLKGDPSFYVIDLKLVSRNIDGTIEDRINPYKSRDGVENDSLNSSLGIEWT